jgi:hypothetical protein
VGLLRGYGNAIVPQVAAEFIAAYLDLNESNVQGMARRDGRPPCQDGSVACRPTKKSPE